MNIEAEPNTFAYVALLAWPLAAMLCFLLFSKYTAFATIVLGAQVLLPAGASLKLQAVPAIDKVSVAAVSAMVACLYFARFRGTRHPRLLLVDALLVLYLVSPILTSFQNGDAVLSGGRWLPGVGLYDAVSEMLSRLIAFLPFFVGRLIMDTPRATEATLRVLVSTFVLYSVLMLFELQMSPQLHRWVYGYHPHEFIQQMRDGGFRPVVFMGHGLLVAFYVATATVAAAALWRTRVSVFRLPAGGVLTYLSGLLVLCKSAGPLAYAATLGPLVALASPRLQVRVASVLVLIALAYPLSRAASLFPSDALVNIAAAYSPERAASLSFRFNQEESLLDRATERWWFGWGRFGRNRVFSQGGEDVSVTDGRWIITLGSFGFFGFLAEFGVLAIAVWYGSRTLRYVPLWKDRAIFATLALLCGLTLVDQLWNASLGPWNWFLAGSLVGRAAALLGGKRQAIEVGARPRVRIFAVPTRGFGHQRRAER